MLIVMIKANVRNEELILKQEREARAPNIIIHRVIEETDATGSIEENDKVFVNSLFEILGSRAEPKKIVRLGKPEASRTRPLKIVMNTVSEKENIMANLKRLKDAEQIYKNVSITDDYTQIERNEIKVWNEKAKAANLEAGENSKFVFKMRGTPKNGLSLARFAKQKS